MLAAARARGLDEAAVLEAAKVVEVPEDSWSTVPITAHFGVIETCIRRLDDPGFVIDIAEHVPVETYDVMGFAMRSAPDLGSAVEVARRYQPLYTSSSVFEVERRDDELTMWFQPTGPLPLAARCATESAVAQWMFVARQLSGAWLVPGYVGFRHRAPRRTERHRKFFGVDIEWGAERASVRYRNGQASLPVRGADGELHAFLLRAAESALSEHRAPHSFIEHARRLASELLPSGKLDLERLAGRLGMTGRTMRRRLVENGTSFSKLRDEIRYDLARRYLGERSLPVQEIAFLLDFADERAFRRSFHRWTGATPAQFRASDR